jgi:hypothetical protein
MEIPMIEKIVQTAKHSVKARVLSQRAFCWSARLDVALPEIARLRLRYPWLEAYFQAPANMSVRPPSLMWINQKEWQTGNSNLSPEIKRNPYIMGLSL